MLSTEIEARSTVKTPVPNVRTRPIVSSFAPHFKKGRLRHAAWLFIALACLGVSWFTAQCFFTPQASTFTPNWAGAQWIQAADDVGPVAYFRYTTTLNGPSDAAFVTVAASQVFRLYVNGTFVGSNAADFAWGNYPRAYIFDINSLLVSGQNVMALRVANLDTHRPMMRAAIGIVEGQSIIYRVSGNGWQATTQSTLVFAHTTTGPGSLQSWTRIGFDATSWQPILNASHVSIASTLTVNPALYEHPSNSQWISVGSGHDGYFVRQFTAPLLNKGVWLRLAASGTANVFLNGQLLIRWNGQTILTEQNITDFLSDDPTVVQYRSGLVMGIYNIAPYLRVGVNTIAVHVTAPGTGAAQVGLDTLSAAMSASMLIEDARGNDTWLTTTADWRASPRPVAGWSGGSSTALAWPPSLAIGRPGSLRAFYLQDNGTSRSQQFLPLSTMLWDVILSVALTLGFWLLVALVFIRRYFATRRAALEAAALVFPPALALEGLLIALVRESLIPQPFPYTWQWGIALIALTGVSTLLVRYSAARRNAHGTTQYAPAHNTSQGGGKPRPYPTRSAPTRQTNPPYRVGAGLAPALARVTHLLKSRPALFLREHWALVAIFLLALPLISYGLPYEPYWQDELTSYFAARGVLAHGLPMMPSGFLYPKGELYTYFLALSMLIFGDQGGALRIPSVLEYLVSIPLFYATACYFFEKRIAILATAMLAFSPIALLWGREVRMYEQAQFFTLLVVYLFYRALDVQASIPLARRKRYIYLAMLSIVLAYLSHEETFITFPSLVCCALLCSYPLLKRMERLPKMRVRALTHGVGKHWIIATLLAVSIIGGQLMIVHFSHPVVLGTDQSQRPLILFTTDNVMYYIDLLFFPGVLGKGTPWITLNSILAVSGCIMAIRSGSARARYCAVFLSLSFFTLTFAFTLASDRYIYPVLPLYYALGAYALYRLLRGLKRFASKALRPTDGHLTRSMRVVLGSVTALVCALTLISPALPISSYNLAVSRAAGLDYHRHYVDYDSIGTYMHQYWKPGDIVISVSPAISVLYYTGHIDYFFSLDRALYLFERDGHIIDTPTGSIAILDQQDFQTIIAEHTRIWIVSDNGLYQSATLKRFTFPPDFHIVYEGYGSALYFRNG